MGDPEPSRPRCCCCARIVLLIGAAGRVLPGMFGGFHDDAIYVLTAKAMATGHGYRLINPRRASSDEVSDSLSGYAGRNMEAVPSFPTERSRPPLHFNAGRRVQCRVGVLLLVRFGYSSRGVALATGLIIATAPVVLFFSAQALSEMPFA